MDIFVGNLSFESTQDDLRKLFEGFGNVASAVIVMRKERKAPKSRGFGFVGMPDEQQALAAIAALNGKEFMGRVINVNPARPKTQAERKIEIRKKRQPMQDMETRPYSRQGRGEKKTWFKPVFNKPEEYKGRRTRSYLKKRELAGIQEEAKPRRKIHDNPLRWRKKKAGERKPRVERSR